MIPRYEHAGIKAIWTDEAKLGRWDRVELAVIEARCKLGLVSDAVHRTIFGLVAQSPVNIPAWLEREKETEHDLAAYVGLRWEMLPAELSCHFHDGMTSYDTEDPAFVLALQESSNHVADALITLIEHMWTMAKRFRHLPMIDRSHGQWAKLASFGSRLLMWRAELAEAHHALIEAQSACLRSRIAGAIGTYGSKLTPEIERRALQSLGLAPFYGAGQIAPRTLYLRIAQALDQTAIVLAKIALDFELGARSGMPLWQEPFRRTQKGSSAMPHKKNPIAMEQTEGLAELASGFVLAIAKSAKTKERRDIGQSCVERTAWPDLFHTLMRMLGNVTRIFRGMAVYPENMLREIEACRGTYASEDVKGFLAERLATKNIGAEVAYRITQLACYNAYPPPIDASIVKDANVPGNHVDGYLQLVRLVETPPTTYRADLQKVLLAGALEPSRHLEATGEVVAGWNTILRELFSEREAWESFTELFTFRYQLQGEPYLFELFDM